MKPGGVSRRGFLRIAALSQVGVRAGWLLSPLQPRRLHYAFVGTTGETRGVSIYAVEGTRWNLQHDVPGEAPVSLALHPSRQVLYVLHDTSVYEGLPRGFVEAFKVDAATGRLTLLGRQGLSLSATRPRHMAVSPNGERLAVAVHGGGAYNALPIEADGRLGQVSGIIKETGCGPVAEHQETAHPQAVVFDTTGTRVIGADLGSDRLSVLSLEDGLQVVHRHPTRPGSGPQHLALHPSGHLLYVANALDGSISGFRYNASTGKISYSLLQIRGAYREALAMHPTGHFLYASSEGDVTAWRIESSTGNLLRTQQQRFSMGDVRAMTASADGRELIALTPQGILRMEVDPITGCLGDPLCAACISNAQCIAVNDRFI